MDIVINTKKKFFDYINGKITDYCCCVIKDCTIDNITISKSLKNALFKNCTFSHVKFTDVMMPNVSFNGCHFNHVVFSRCIMISAYIWSCNMEYVTIENSVLNCIQFDTNEEGTTFRLHKVEVNDCMMHCAMFCGKRGSITECDLCGCDLTSASFTPNCTWKECNFGNSNFSRANMNSTMIECNFSKSSLYDMTSSGMFKKCTFDGSNLTNTAIANAELDDCSFDHTTAGLALVPPSHGEYIAWKVASSNDGDHYLVKLLIPADAQRSSATTRKCRASKAKVLDFYTLDMQKASIKELHSSYMVGFIYKRGKTITIEDFDTNRWNECSTGIHHFITIDEAIEWATEGH